MGVMESGLANGRMLCFFNWAKWDFCLSNGWVLSFYFDGQLGTGRLDRGWLMAVCFLF